MGLNCDITLHLQEQLQLTIRLVTVSVMKGRDERAVQDKRSAPQGSTTPGPLETGVNVPCIWSTAGSTQCNGAFRPKAKKGETVLCNSRIFVLNAPLKNCFVLHRGTHKPSMKLCKELIVNKHSCFKKDTSNNSMLSQIKKRKTSNG